MKIAFLVSSAGDTELAFQTIKALEKKPEQHEVVLVSLAKVIQPRIDSFQSPLVVEKKALAEILELGDAPWSELHCEDEQLQRVRNYIHEQQIAQAYIGIPSVSNNEIPLQIAESLNEIPVLMAYEFMFKPPEEHALWQYMPALGAKQNLKWALPLETARDDFPAELNTRVIGHQSIDNAYATQPPSPEKISETRGLLNVGAGQDLAFLSSTTQNLAVDTEFLNCVLAELPNHPGMQLRLGLHPGIKDMDAYMQAILAIYKQHPAAASQFKIILPANLLARFEFPDLTINNPEFHSAFVQANVSGSDAAAAATRVTQAVPGALLNTAALEGKPAYSHLGKPYLPSQYFTESLATFFSAARKEPPQRADLNLDEQSAAESCAAYLLSGG